MIRIIDVYQGKMKSRKERNSVNCKNCNRTRIEESIAIVLTDETGDIGAKSSKGIFTYAS